ncbi:MAG: tetratricopeptide repeat protein [Thermodesulfobacteriota bacterium]
MSGNEETILSGRWGRLAAVMGIVVTAILVYSNALQGPFLVDDRMYILGNPAVRELGSFLDLSGTRYVAFLSFALNYAASEYSTFGYHLTNVAIHTINGLLVWWLVLLTFRAPAMERTGVDPSLKYFVALASALVFISHPVQTQAVTYITQRFTSLAVLFYLLSLALYVKWRLSPELKGRAALYLFSLVSAVLAMKTKEISFTLPAVIILYEFTFFGRSFNGHELRPRTQFLPLLPFLLTMAIIPLELFGPELGLWEGRHGVDEEFLRKVQVEDLSTVPPYAYLITQSRVVVTYLRLLVLPVGQRMDYDYPFSHSIFEPEVFLSFLFLLSLFGFAVYLFLRSRITHHAHGLLASFGIIWFFITLSIESSIIPIKDPIAEHRLYLPLAGLSVSFAAAVSYLSGAFRRGRGGRGAWVAVLVIVAALSVAAHTRNRVWADELTFWHDEVSKSPGKATVHDGLGLAYQRMGRAGDALREFEEAVALGPGYAGIHNNLGILYFELGRMDDAVREFEAAVRLVPGFAEAHNNLAGIYYVQGRLDEAIEEYREALRLSPGYAEIHYNLAIVYKKKGLTEEAAREIEALLQIRPDHEEAKRLRASLSGR